MRRMKNTGFGFLIPAISLAILTGSWAYAVYDYGGVLPDSWRWSLVGIAARCLLFWMSGRTDGGKPRQRGVSSTEFSPEVPLF